MTKLASLDLVNDHRRGRGGERCVPDAVAAMSEAAAGDVAAVFKALSSPARLHLLTLLAGGEQVCVCDLAKRTALSQSTVSHHLGILSRAGLVRGERRGTWVWYELLPDRLDEARALLLPRVSLDA
ncbi:MULTISPECIES: ArsR/SmtB family transcription factor [Amycolatopsis]|uniref:Metalloregulator ArsR/SmtB family transcription factor n=1 Tax=Amycolatopsis thermalba TaxID=944492 RepID=A0ABY4NXK6_9PSEU|nr:MULTISPECIES: metalloregulator ArsR/SmtB family transcription factor [Amycolatopsis]OXM74997.1 transcriptional regulator [Amycolatopsis sp. KNN50.9b]UQS24817.1 metalloregulator ArsR/SmtB family transcription factor [Amycolatopsis thermalba]